MLWTDYLRLVRYAAKHPPLQPMIQGFLGVRPKSAPAAADAPQSLRAAFPDGIIR